MPSLPGSGVTVGGGAGGGGGAESDPIAGAALAAHIADTTDAHDASAISVADGDGNFTGDDVEEVLAELFDAIGGGGGGLTIETSDYTVIEHVELGVAGTFDFQNIPQGYKHLKVLVMGGTSDGSAQNLLMRFNADAGSNYHRELMASSDTNLAADGQRAQSSLDIGTVPASAVRSGHADLTIFDYARTTTYHKGFVGTAGRIDGDGTDTDLNVHVRTGWWANTAPITRVQVFPQAGNFRAGSTATLVGIGGDDVASVLTGDGQSYLGHDAVGASWETLTDSRWLAKQVTLTEGALVSIEAHLRRNGSQVESLGWSIWTDNAGTPDVVLGGGRGLNDQIYLGGTSDPSAGRWYRTNGAVWLEAGTYWFGVAGFDMAGAHQIAYDAGGSDHYYTNSGGWYQSDWTLSGTFPETIGTRNYSIRVAVVDAGPSLTINEAGAVPLTPYETRASVTALTQADSGKTIDITAAITQTFDAAASLGAGWFVDIRNKTVDGSTVVTLDPNGGELIDGATTLHMWSGETRRIICTGTAFVTVLLAQGLGLYAETQTSLTSYSASEATSSDWLTLGAQTYDAVPILIECDVQGSVGSGSIIVTLWDGATELCRFLDFRSGSPGHRTFKITPSAGSHTYACKVFGNSGNALDAGSGVAGSATYPPAFMRATKV